MIIDNWSAFAQFLLPQDCVLCGRASGGPLLCAPCREKLPRAHLRCCPQCAAPGSGDLCGACLKRSPAFDETIAGFGYVFPVDALVKALKYRGLLALAAPLAHGLLEKSPALPDIIVPMPLHRARLKERGFNQAMEIARALAWATRAPLAADICFRVLDTKPQTNLPWKERAKNVRKAFACNAALNGAQVAVVDDVMTTGSTMHELARTLKKHGAARVSAWVVARASK